MAIDLAKVKSGKMTSAGPSAPPPAHPSPPSAPKGASALKRLATARFLTSKKVPLEEVVFFTQQLALLLQTGNGLVPSISALAGQVGSPVLQRVLREVHSRLEEGNELSESLRQHPATFDHMYVSLVKAGEATRHRRESLERLLGILDIRRRLQSRIREAMTYPALLAVVMTAVIIFVFTFMIPRFAELFSSLGDDLPASTRLLVGLSDQIRSRWWVWVPMLILAGVGAGRLGRTAFLRRTWARVKMSLPVAGKLYAEAYLFQLSSTLGLLLGSRVPHLEAIRIVRDVVKTPRYESFFANLEKNVEAGRGVAPAFQEASFFPDTVKLMVTTGESSGALDTVMGRLADHYREELESDIRRLSSMLEPAMLVGMGLMVGFIAISLIVPILRMSRTIH
jgi:type II secretory pathway component PulF